MRAQLISAWLPPGHPRPVSQGYAPLPVRPAGIFDDNSAIQPEPEPLLASEPRAGRHQKGCSQRYLLLCLATLPRARDIHGTPRLPSGHQHTYWRRAFQPALEATPCVFPAMAKGYGKFGQANKKNKDGGGQGFEEVAPKVRVVQNYS